VLLTLGPVREFLLSPLGRNAKCKRKKKHGWSNKVTDLFYGQTAVMDAPSPAPSPPKRGRGEKGKYELTFNPVRGKWGQGELSRISRTPRMGTQGGFESIHEFDAD